MQGFGDITYDMSTVEELRRVATHIVARARFQATGRFSLRVTPGGFGTPEFGDDQRRVRVSGSTLIVESDAERAASTSTKAINGSALPRLAHIARVGLSTPLSVGHDTPPVGQLAQAITLDEPTVDAVCRWFGVAAGILDRVALAMQTTGSPSLVRLWPEHFDVAFDVLARPGTRVNLGASPGDGYLPEPYLYVGPWTDARPGGGTFWNAPFGAARPASSFDTVDDGFAFLMEGVGRLAQNWSPPPMPEAGRQG